MNILSFKEIKMELPPVAQESEIWALDTELSGLNENQLHRPYGRLTSLAGTCDGETVYIIFGSDEVSEFLQRIEKATWVMHNATFDIGHLRRWAAIPERKNLRDTMLIEKVMFSDYYDDFGLDDLVRRYLRCYMPKGVRKEFHELEGAMTKEQIEYAALDVIGTWLVDREQQKIIETKDRLIWERVDLPTIWTSLDLSGFTVDTDKWFELAEHNQEIVDRIEEELGKKYGKSVKKMSGRGKNRKEIEEFVPFNPASSTQVLVLLKEQGLEVSSTGDDAISPYRNSNEFVAKILEYRGAAKKVSTYGKSYMKFVEEDGRIYPSLQVIGASSGRNSCRAPNLQQIIRSGDYRSCFVAGRGKKLIIADYSAQEPRIFASICKDGALLEIFNSGKDIYCEVARVAFRENITKQDKERRNQIKALVLGLIYGLSPYGFARDNEVDQETAEDMFDKFFDAFPTASQWVKDQQLYNKGIARSVLGRKGHLHPYNAQWKRNALNFPMQSSGADMTKLAMKEFRKVNRDMLQVGRVGIVLPVHDEIILWCVDDIAEDMKKSLENCMCKVASLIHVGVPPVVEAHIADSWAEK